MPAYKKQDRRGLIRAGLLFADHENHFVDMNYPRV